MAITAVGRTDVGRERSMNEDAHSCDPNAGLFVVCDGMGGAAAGEVASRETVRALVESVARGSEAMRALGAERGDPGLVGTLLRTTIERVCGELYTLGKTDRTKRGLGTTCTALAIAGGRAMLAHVGDSRCYLLRQGQLTQLTADHTYVAEAIRNGVLKAEDAHKSPYGNVIIRAVGPQKTVIVDLVPFDVVPGDVLLLCSDGLHQYFRDPAELARFAGEKDLDAASGKLIALANERGGSDNITVVLARIDGTATRTSNNTLARVDALRHVELFRDLDMAEVIRLGQAFEPRDIPAGEFVIREGDGAESFFVLVSGTVDVFRGNQTVARLPAGSHFGEIALLGQRPRTASVQATVASHVFVTNRTRLFPFLEREPMLAAKLFYKLAQTLSLRLDDLYAQTAPTGALANPRETVRFGSYPMTPDGRPRDPNAR